MGAVVEEKEIATVTERWYEALPAHIQAVEEFKESNLSLPIPFAGSFQEHLRLKEQ